MTNIELMEGLEILSVSDTMPAGIGILLGVLCFGVIALSTYLLADSIMEGSGVGVIISLVFIGIGMFLSGVVASETFCPTPTYKVLVDDSVSMNEFYDKYEILNVEGKIYTIELKGE